MSQTKIDGMVRYVKSRNLRKSLMKGIGRMNWKKILQYALLFICGGAIGVIWGGRLLSNIIYFFTGETYFLIPVPWSDAYWQIGTWQ